MRKMLSEKIAKRHLVVVRGRGSYHKPASLNSRHIKILKILDSMQNTELDSEQISMLISEDPVQIRPRISELLGLNLVSASKKDGRGFLYRITSQGKVALESKGVK
jgi:predicted transcriptional regulator